MAGLSHVLQILLLDNVFTRSIFSLYLPIFLSHSLPVLLLSIPLSAITAYS